MIIKDLENLIVCDDCGCVFDKSKAEYEIGHYSKKEKFKCPACKMWNALSN